MTQLLITGSAGMLARAVREALTKRNTPFAAPPEAELPQWTENLVAVLEQSGAPAGPGGASARHGG